MTTPPSGIADAYAWLGTPVEDASEETFFIFSQDVPSSNLGYIDNTSSTIDIDIGSRSLTLRQSPGLLKSDRSTGTTGAVLWKITPLVAQWLVSMPSCMCNARILHSEAVVIELGCGVSGLIGIVMAPLVSTYILSDQAYVMKTLRCNVDANPQLIPLDWETDDATALKHELPEGRAVNLVVVCDCVYNEHLIPPLVRTLTDVCGLVTPAEEAPFALIAQQLRSADVFEQFLDILMSHFVVWRMPDKHLPGTLQSGNLQDGAATATQAPLICRALDLDLHVMCEKPIMVDVITTKEVVAKAASKPRLGFLVPFSHDDLYRAAKLLAETGSLGEIHAVETCYLDQQDSTATQFPPSFIDIGRYCRDVKSSLTNPRKQVNRVIAMGQQAVYGDLAKYGDADNGWGRTLTNGFEGTTRVCDSRFTRNTYRYNPDAFVLYDRSFLNYLAEFADVIIDYGPVTCSPDDAYEAAQIVIALQFSFRNGLAMASVRKGLPSLAIIDDYLRTSAPHFAHIPAKALRITTFNDTIVPSNVSDQTRLVQRLKPFEVISSVRERTAFPGSLLRSLPNLKLLLATGTQFEMFDLSAARELGIIVAAAPGLGRTDGKGPRRPNIKQGGVHPTTQHTWALIMALARNVPADDAALKAGHPWHTRLATNLTGLTLGVVGLGRLGAAVARIGQLCWGMRVVCWSENLTQAKADGMAADLGLPVKGPDGDKTFRAVSKAELFGAADVVSLHYVLSERSRGIVGAEELALMKETAMLVNTSRGPLINHAALLEALGRGAISGAAMDVFDVEPLPLDSPWRRSNYWGHDGRSRLIITPHMGYADQVLLDTWYAETAENVERWLDSKDILHRLA
ncbi:hypothetical protein DV736_g6423, partial [Chaetothyriales sp. CBS 134916]